MSNALVPYEAPVLSREEQWEEQFQHIIAELAAGRSVSKILREDDGMPPPRTFWNRIYRNEVLYEKISRAREFGADALLDEARAIADTPMEGEEVMMEFGPDGAKRRITRKDMLGHRRLQIDTRVKYAQMIAPRKYGPKLDLTSDGEGLASIAERVRAGNKRIELKRKDD